MYSETAVSRAPSALEHKVFIVLPLLYAALILCVLPFATLPGIANPYVATMSASGVLFADICTALLLGSEYRRRGQPSFLYLTCAYFFSAMMALLHLLTFPGAILPQQILGNPQTVSWLFAAWRAGTAILFLTSIFSSAAPANEDSESRRTLRLVQAVALTGLACALIAAVFINAQFVSTIENRFTGITLWMNWATVFLYVFGALIIWKRQAFNDALYLWLAIVLMASAADLVLTTFSGARYTLGWYIGRASWVISACVLLLLWLTHDSVSRFPKQLRWIGSYGSALCVLMAALLLHWFLLPWLGTLTPFATSFASVAIAVWVGGWGAALMVAGTGYVISNIFFTQPIGHFEISTASHQISLVLYCLTASTIIGLGEAMRRARDDCRVSEQRFRHSQESSLHGYALLHAVRDRVGLIVDFEIDYLNPQGAAMMRVSQANMARKSFLALMPGAKDSGLFGMLEQAVTQKIPGDVENFHETNGVSYYLRNIVSPFDDGVAVSFFDITETKCLEFQLKQRAAELEQADTNKRQFLAVLAHELRNPMAPLRNALGILTMNPDKSVTDTIIPIMDRQLGHLTRLVDDLLDISRIDRGKLHLNLKHLNIETVVKNAVETTKPGIEESLHDLVVRSPADPIFVQGDLVRLTQVIANLINNASKFTPRHGQISISMRVDGNVAVVSVIDTGIGIPPEKLSNIFDMFVQLDTAKGAESTGLGLGLTIARSIAIRHGGNLEAFSPGLGRGSEFVLRLPIAPSPFEEQPKESVPRAASGSRRILVVDDNEDAATTLGDLLLLTGHEVRVAFSGAQALSHIVEFVPDVAFIDLNMPGMDGIELAEKMQNNPLTSNARLIALTGMGQQSDVDRTNEAGFYAHLTKPVLLERIIHIISTLNTTTDIWDEDTRKSAPSG